MNVYTMIHVRRTPVRRTCTAYMYHSVNTLLVLTMQYTFMRVLNGGRLGVNKPQNFEPIAYVQI